MIVIGAARTADRAASPSTRADIEGVDRPLRGQGGVAVWDREVARRVGRDAIGPVEEGVAGLRWGWEGDGAAVVLVREVADGGAAILKEGDVELNDRPLRIERVAPVRGEVIEAFICIWRP